MSILVALTPTPPPTTNDFAWDEDPPEEDPDQEFYFAAGDDFVPPRFSNPVFDDGEIEETVEPAPLPDEAFPSPVFSDVGFDDDFYDEILADLILIEESVSHAVSMPIPDEDENVEAPPDFFVEDDLTPPSISNPVFDEDEVPELLATDPLLDEEILTGDSIPPIVVFDWLGEDDPSAEEEFEAQDPTTNEPYPATTEPPDEDAPLEDELEADFFVEDDLAPPSISNPVLDEDEIPELLAADLLLDEEILTGDPLPPVVIFDWLGEDDPPAEEEFEAQDPTPDEQHPATTEPPPDEDALLEDESEPDPRDEDIPPEIVEPEELDWLVEAGEAPEEPEPEHLFRDEDTFGATTEPSEDETAFFDVEEEVTPEDEFLPPPAPVSRRRRKAKAKEWWPPAPAAVIRIEEGPDGEPSARIFWAGEEITVALEDVPTVLDVLDDKPDAERVETSSTSIPERVETSSTSIPERHPFVEVVDEPQKPLYKRLLELLKRPR